MSQSAFPLIYFFYGLAFFSMGLMVSVEGGRSNDARLRMALRPLAAFGFVHAFHEWIEMFKSIRVFPPVWLGVIDVIELSFLVFSFLSLAAFGSYLALGSEATWRISLLVPLGMEALWVFGLTQIQAAYPLNALPDAADVWTRYSLAIPASLLAAAGLVVQQRAFRRSGLIRFGQDSLWAAVAFIWYGLVGQVFTRPSLLPPSDVFNQTLFVAWFGFPVQILRAVMAVFSAVFVIRFLRAFQVESDRKIAQLQQAQLDEAQQRERLRAELFRKVVSAQEAERQRIARDLHDATGQSLTALGMGLRAVADSMKKKENRADFLQLESIASDALKELQRIIADLRPAHLDELGLSATLRWYANRAHELTNLMIRVDVGGEEPPLDSAVKIAIFRIVQEALNNVIKHSHATNVNIKVEYRTAKAFIHVRDNGLGFDVESARHRGGRVSLGLEGMKERAALLGGSLNVSSRPNYGTEIEAVIPCDSERKEIDDTLIASG
ncbi:MAG: hypothetical protein Fur002_23210 [Anaerolineales bacterium]